MEIALNSGVNSWFETYVLHETKEMNPGDQGT
jgi:hypothetical protein